MPLSLIRNHTLTTGSLETNETQTNFTMSSNVLGFSTTPLYSDTSYSAATTSTDYMSVIRTDVAETSEEMYNTYMDNSSTATPDLQQVVTMSTKDALEKGLISWDDATWILTSAFIIFTMQSGFGLLEAGCVSAKNEVNIMVKNAVDVVFGGFAYWLFGYGLSFGEGQYSNRFVGFGEFLVDTKNGDDVGLVFSNFIFQLSFATTATTIVSGAMAERTKLSAYVAFSFLNTIVYCVPAHWIWTSEGFLNQMGTVDIAGSGGVHLVGGVSALVATIMLKPRLGRFEKSLKTPAMGNATNAMVGMFMLWWGWLGFNCGSTFGISYGKWKLAAKSAVITMCASMGGGIVGVFFKSAVTTINGSVGGGALGLFFSYWWRKKIYNVGDLVNSILGALVSITAGCAVIRPWEAIVIGAMGSIIVILATDLLNLLRIDDPVGASPVHAFAGVWGLLAVGLFVEDEPVMKLNNGQVGLFKGGGLYSLGIQALTAVAIAAWSAATTFTLLWVIKCTLGLRLSEYEERMGSDFVEHGIKRKLSLSYLTPEELMKLNSLDGDCCDQRLTYGLRKRSGFGFTRDVADVIPRNDLLHVSDGITHNDLLQVTPNRNHQNGHSYTPAYENEGLELSVVEEEHQDSNNMTPISNYI